MNKTIAAARIFLAPTLIAPALIAFASPALAAQPIAGKWLTDNGEALVEIAPCGKAMCGKVIKVLKPKPGAKPSQGVAILTELKDSGSLWKGKVFNPESGKSYNAKVYRNADGTLKVEGCVAFLCKGPTWQPAH
jgi:uncharacterized protein (DUF2147 family)